MSAYDWDPQQQQQQQHLRFAEPPPPRPVNKKAIGGGGGGGNKRSRQTYSKYQTAVLETVFRTSKYIVRSKRQQMSAELDLTERQIKIWFQNRRMKEKKCRKEVHRAGVDAERIVAAAAANDRGVECDDDDDDDDDYDPLLSMLRDDPFAGGAGGYRDGSAARPAPRLQQDGLYAAGYDLQLGTVDDPYDDGLKLQQQWPTVHHTVTAVDYHQDLYGNRDHDHDRFQRIQQPPSMHHHHHHHRLHYRGPLSSQIPDYCNGNGTSLQQLHGY